MALTLWTAINLSRACCLFQARLTTAVQLTPFALPGVSGVPDDQQNINEVVYITVCQGGTALLRTDQHTQSQTDT